MIVLFLCFCYNASYPLFFLFLFYILSLLLCGIQNNLNLQNILKFKKNNHELYFGFV